MYNNIPWDEAREEWFRANPDGSQEEFRGDFPDDAHTWEAWRRRRADVLGRGRSIARRCRPNGLGLQRREAPDGMPEVWTDKREEDFVWTDLLEPMEELQSTAKKASGSQDTARVQVLTDRPLPLLLISDFHFGSWGTNYRQVAEIVALVKRRGLFVGVLGDMLQMSIKLRNVLEVSDNMIPPRFQMRAHESLMEELAQHILFSMWDNHTVMREEAVTGYSRYAEVIKEKTIYHSGIGHLDLLVGGEVGYETYRIAASHRFRGNSYMNPTHGQMRYGRHEGQDREIIVAGDSHVPAVQNYTDGPTPKVAINCGTLQTDSGYAKRHYSLFTHDWMPVVEFWPDRHLFFAYPSLTHWLAKNPGEGE